MIVVIGVIGVIGVIVLQLMVEEEPYGVGVVIAQGVIQDLVNVSSRGNQGRFVELGANIVAEVVIK